MMQNAHDFVAEKKRIFLSDRRSVFLTVNQSFLLDDHYMIFCIECMLNSIKTCVRITMK